MSLFEKLMSAQSQKMFSPAPTTATTTTATTTTTTTTMKRPTIPTRSPRPQITPKEVRAYDDLSDNNLVGKLPAIAKKLPTIGKLYSSDLLIKEEKGKLGDGNGG